MLRQIILSILLVGLLEACGFHLRGASELPSTVKFAVIDGVAQYSNAGLEVKQQLELSGTKVQTSADVDTVHFVVLRNNFTRRVLSVDASGAANEYELTYTFSMRVLDPKGKLLVAPWVINLNRNYIYDPTKALAKSDEVTNIKLQMISLAVRQAMRRIGIKLKQIAELNSSDIKKSEPLKNRNESKITDTTVK